MPEAARHGPRELSGKLAEGVLPGLLRAIYVGRKTGVLSVTHGRDRGDIVFVHGHIVHGNTTVQRCHMGEAMVRHGLLTQPDLDRATLAVNRTGKRLGQALLDLGIIDKPRLEDALALHVREVLLCIFSWHEGAYAFGEKRPDDFRGYDQPLKLSTGEMILDAVRGVRDPDVVRYALGDVDQVLVLSTDPLLRFQRITMTPIDGFILSRVDGTLTAREILKITPVGREEAERSLFGLLCTGMAEYLQRREGKTAVATREEILEAGERLAIRDHFEVLEIKPEARRPRSRRPTSGWPSASIPTSSTIPPSPTCGRRSRQCSTGSARPTRC